jgi:hypothetical protein
MTTVVFSDFASAVRKRFNQMAQGKLFIVEHDKDAIWNKYLSSFPPGTNPMFRKRCEYDCSCCRHFIHSVGAVVSVENGQLTTIWDDHDLHPTFQAVADAMSRYVQVAPVQDIYLTDRTKAGQDSSKELKDGETITWRHFCIDIPSRFRSFTVDAQQGQARTSFQVFKRAITELTPSAVKTTLELIDSKTPIYRGAEFKQPVLAFQKLQSDLTPYSGRQLDLRIWESLGNTAGYIRNSAIGTLLQDLSEGKDEDQAVRSYESKVAPQNYKRPTAVITQGMRESAMKTITELDLEPALARRHAKLSDVSITSVLWVDGDTRGFLKGGIADLLSQHVKPAAFDAKKAKPIKIDDFLKLGHRQGISLYLENKLVPHFVSMTAPVHPEVKHLFRWNNDFAWSYNGDVADSIKEKVKRAGGQVEGVALRCSLAWFNYDDLDLHCITPRGEHISFSNKAGILDVDMNAGGPSSREAVENMRWVNPPDGVYHFSVHNYSRRETVDLGFVIEVEGANGVHTFRHEKAVANKATVEVCRVQVSKGQVVAVTPSSHVVAGESSKDMWGLKTLDLVKVQAIVLSPNYWDDNAVGNKHWFFILEGCKNPQPCRGIYNEFLHPRLDQHRKAFEVVGSRHKCPVVDEQLSGVGFSSTRQDTVIAVSNGVSYSISF